eukprot:TRINITY_DN168_c0_g2_i1.p1 TRINITY_DN168_c0_g2~~TRINITY_DN168_c0_g2_i1.p1  ORF type:complete len:315 (+),score=48.72 TRINITY_DN168_c0_g2_i1:43-987(+)
MELLNHELQKSTKNSSNSFWKCFVKCVFIGQSALSHIAYLLGPVCVLVALTLITGIIYVYFTAILPYYTDSYFSFIGLPHLILAFWLIFNIYFNYLMAIFTSPGHTPETYSINEEYDEDDIESVFKFCRSCKKPKPPRAHHCSVCNRCVLRMDHHCPWVANCVGHGNYKYFVLFLFWLSVSCLYICIMTISPFQLVSTTKKYPVDGISGSTIGFAMILCASVSFAVGGMLLWHLYLIYSQQTSIEFYLNRSDSIDAKKLNIEWHNPYDLGIHKNFDAVFGKNSLWWRWTLPSRKPTPGNGVDWEEFVPNNLTYC